MFTPSTFRLLAPPSPASPGKSCIRHCLVNGGVKLLIVLVDRKLTGSRMKFVRISRIRSKTKVSHFCLSQIKFRANFTWEPVNFGLNKYYPYLPNVCLNHMDGRGPRLVDPKFVYAKSS